MGLKYERPWLNGHKWTFTFGTYSLGENNDFDFNSIQKIDFHFFPI